MVQCNKDWKPLSVTDPPGVQVFRFNAYARPANSGASNVATIISQPDGIEQTGKSQVCKQGRAQHVLHGLAMSIAIPAKTCKSVSWQFAGPLVSRDKTWAIQGSVHLQGHQGTT